MYLFRGIILIDTGSIIKESQCAQRFSLTLTISIHQFVERRRALDFKKDLTTILNWSDCHIFGRDEEVGHTLLTTYAVRNDLKAGRKWVSYTLILMCSGFSAFFSSGGD